MPFLHLPFTKNNFRFILVSRGLGIHKSNSLFRQNPAPKLELDFWIPQSWQYKIKIFFANREANQRTSLVSDSRKYNFNTPSNLHVFLHPAVVVYKLGRAVEF